MMTCERETVFAIADALGPHLLDALKQHGHTPLTIFEVVARCMGEERVRRAKRKHPTPERWGDDDEQRRAIELAAQ